MLKSVDPSHDLLSKGSIEDGRFASTEKKFDPFWAVSYAEELLSAAIDKGALQQ